MSSPFTFVGVEGRDQLDDEVNGLRLCLYQWPEYNFSVALSPVAGAQAEAWPLSSRAYFEFGIGYRLGTDKEAAWISHAMAHQPFERDFPGRTEELLDVALPLAPQLFADGWQMKEPSFPPLAPKLRPTLLEKGSYFPHRDEVKSEATLAFERTVEWALELARAEIFGKGKLQ